MYLLRNKNDLSRQLLLFSSRNLAAPYLSQQTLSGHYKPMSSKLSSLKLVYEYPRFKDTLIIGTHFSQDKIYLTTSKFSSLVDLQFYSFDRKTNFVDLISNVLSKYHFIKHILLYRTDDCKKGIAAFLNKEELAW